MGMGLGIVLILIILLTGVGGRAPAPEKNPASSGVTRVEWVTDIDKISSNTCRSKGVGLPASLYRIADECLVGGGPSSSIADHSFIDHGFTWISMDWLNQLIEKIWQKESSGRPNPPDGDKGRAIGPLQIHQEALADVNQRFGLKFTHEDMRDIRKAKIVVQLYITMWMDVHKEEIAARIFHYGPTGWRGKDVDGYWEKIKNIR